MSNFFNKHQEFLAEDASHRGQAPSVGEYEGRQRLDKAAVIDLHRIEADPQHREHFSEVELEQLAQSLRHHGQLQPIRVRYEDRRDKYVLIAGERRYRAAGIAGLTSIEAIVVSGDITEAQILREQILENTLREGLLPSEQAAAFRDLMEKEGLNGKELATYLRLAPSTVSRTLAVLDLPVELREKVDQSEVSIKDAIKQAKVSKGGAATIPSKPKRQSKSKERKIVAGGFTVTVKARRILTEELLREALELARQTLDTESDTAKERKAA